MPVFIILSGMMAKNDLSQDRIRKSITSILIPFLVFTILYETLEFLTTGRVSEYTINFQPYWILWFLYSLFIWKLFLPIILNFRYPIILTILISIVAGYVNDVGYFLGISRTLYFFPFFIIGYKMTSSIFNNTKLMSIPKTVYVVILIFNITLFWMLKDYSHEWLYGSFSYEKLNVESWMAAFGRLSLYCISIITSVSILMLVSTKKLKVSQYGSNSLYAYLWHGFFVKVFVWIGLITLIGQMSAPIVLIIFLSMALVMTFLLSTNFVLVNTQGFLFDPIKKIILSKNKQDDG
jgi:fucose 4-O-acetylase-like acetyltransferase